MSRVQHFECFYLSFQECFNVIANFFHDRHCDQILPNKVLFRIRYLKQNLDHKKELSVKNENNHISVNRLLKAVFLIILFV